jgi:acetyl esterase/lipase
VTAAQLAGPQDRVPVGVPRRRRVARLLMSVLAAVWAILAVILSIGVLAPSFPLLGLAGLYVNGYAAQVFLFGLAGVGVVWAARRLGQYRTAVTTGVVAGVTVVCATVPTVALLSTAHRLGAPVSLPRTLVATANSPDHGASRSVRYATVDGQDLYLDVWLPGRRPAAPGPAVVFVHGGGFVKGSRSETSQWDRWLNDAGYAVFDVGYRLAPPARWDSAAADVGCALSWLRANAAAYRIDPHRVALGGRSAGGNLALTSAFTSPDAPGASSCGGTPLTVCSVFAMFPPVDFTAWWNSDRVLHASRRDTEQYTGGTPSTYPERYAATSPTRHVRPGLPPTLLVVGSNDQFVPPDQSRQLHRGLDQAGVPNQLVELPYTDHDYDLSWNGLATQITQHLVADFLHRTLK